MAVNDLLSQDEIDALLTGVDGGDVETEEDEPAEGAVGYDFGSQERIVRGRMPTLEMINERFARNFRISLFDMLRRTVEIGVINVRMMKFSDYLRNLFLPTSLNLVKLHPLRGVALITLDPKLVFTVVDSYFGGSGKFPFKIEGREFTPVETRLIRMLVDKIFADLEQAWEPVLDLKFEYTGSEVNPQFANIVSPTEIVVVATFTIDLEGTGGEMHVTMPYSMLEPLKEQLEAGVQSDRGEVDERWVRALREEVRNVPVEISSELTSAEITVEELINIKDGDIIPVTIPDTVLVRVANDVSMFHGKFGIFDGYKAIQITKALKHPAFEAGGSKAKGLL